METLVNALRAGIVNISFTAKDGEQRNMRCTLKGDLIGDMPAGGPPSRERLGMVTAWDLDLGQWRAVREDRISSWEVVS